MRHIGVDLAVPVALELIAYAPHPRMVRRAPFGYDARMSVIRGLAVIAAALCLPIACGKKQEQPAGGAPSASASASVLALPASASSAAFAGLKELASGQPSTNAFPLAGPLESALAAPSTSAAPSVSASASTSASAPGPIATKLVGYWVFFNFDLTDASTSAKWNAVPPTMQKDILAEAPKATIEFTRDKLISRLSGVPDKTSTWVIESEDANDLVIKTSDEGRKKIRFVAPEQIRIEELDKKGSFVTLFARTTKPAPAPSISASVVGSAKP